MYRLGYDFIVASEMSSLNTEYSTLFFKHSGIPDGIRVGLVLYKTNMKNGLIDNILYLCISCLTI